MTRRIVWIIALFVLAWPGSLFAQGRGGGRGGRQPQMGSSGRGQMGGDQIRQRDRLRDGTGANCPGCPSLSTSTSGSQTKAQRQAQTRSQNANQSHAQTQNQVRDRNQVQNQTRTQGGTQNQVRTEQQQQTRTSGPQ